MKKRQTILMILLGFLFGYLIGQAEKKKQPLKPETVLKSVKNMVSQHTEVSGSWIYMRSEPYTHHGIDYHVYHGGITKHENGKHVPYEFYVEAYSGTLLDIFPQHQS